MPGFTASLSKLSFESESFRNALNKKIGAFVKIGARKFLEAALPNIPFHTGFVVGAFSKLADFTGGYFQTNTAGSRLFNEQVEFTKKVARLQAKISRTKELADYHKVKELGRIENSLQINKEHLLKVRQTYNSLFSKGPPTKYDYHRSLRIKEAEARVTSRFEKARSRLANYDPEPGRKRYEAALARYKHNLAAAQKRLASLEKRISRETDEHISHILHRASQALGLDPKKLKNKQIPVANKKRKIKSHEIVSGRTLNKAGLLEYYRVPGTKTSVLKTQRSGREFAKGGIEKLGDGSFQFKFSVNISYFNMNDAFANRHTPSAPWGAFAAGQKAFNDYILKAFKKDFEDSFLESFMLETVIKITPNQIGQTTSRFVVR